jgi:hypothetical protein
MEAARIIATLVSGGAVLTLFPASGAQSFLIAAEHRFTRIDLVYYIPGDTITGAIHRLTFDGVRAAPRRVDFLTRGRLAGFLRPARAYGAEREQWRAWQSWLASAGAHYHETIGTALASVSEDARGRRAKMPVVRFGVS